MYDYRPTELPPSLTLILAALDPEEAERLETGFQFAAAAHAGHTRDEGTPYIHHPVAVAGILFSELGCQDIDVLLAALTHDVLEDCDWLDSDALRGVIGDRALGFVECVTKAPVPEAHKVARDRAYLDAMREAPLEARLLKLADRIHNLRSIVHSPDIEKARRYLEVSQAEFIPLALATSATAERLITEACDAVEAHLATLSS